MPSPNMTHKGWLLFCPVYLDLRWNPYGAPEVEPRLPYTDWLFALAAELDNVRGMLGELFGICEHEGFLFKITGSLPVTVENAPTHNGYL